MQYLVLMRDIELYGKKAIELGITWTKNLSKMRYLIFSDVHSDIKAMNSLIEKTKHINCNKIISLGDNIGYGNFPDLVIDLLLNKQIFSIAGNHERSIIDKEELNALSEKAKEAIFENLKFLKSKHIQYIKKLPDFITENNIRFVHALPPKSYSVYINRLLKEEILQQTKLYSEQFVFCGHTHTNGIYEISNNKIKFIEPKFNKTYQLKSDKRYIINIGSLSGNRRTIKTFTLFDSQNNLLEFVNN